MKKLITIAILFISFSAFSQNKDSIALVQQQKAISEIVTKSSVKEFNDFLYKNMTAEKYGEFVQYLNAFIRQKYQQPKTTK